MVQTEIMSPDRMYTTSHLWYSYQRCVNESNHKKSQKNAKWKTFYNLQKWQGSESQRKTKGLSRWDWETWNLNETSDSVPEPLFIKDFTGTNGKTWNEVSGLDGDNIPVLISWC